MTATTEIAARRFTTKSNANRAARQAGLAAWTVEKTNDGQFAVVAGEDIVAEDMNGIAGEAQIAEEPAALVEVTAEEPAEETEEQHDDAGNASTDEVEDGRTTEETQDEAGDETDDEAAPVEVEEETFAVAVSCTPERMAEIARMMAKMADAPVFYRVAGKDLLFTVEPPKARAKAEKPAAAPKDGTPKAPVGNMAVAVELALRPEGATREQMAEKSGKPATLPWTQIIKTAAERYGYGYETRAEGRKTIYFLKAA